VDYLRKLLGISYVTLSADLNISDSGLKKILQKNKVSDIEKLWEIHKLKQTFSVHQKSLSNLNEVAPIIKNTPIFVDAGLISYAKLSRDLKIPETTLKSYCYGGITVSEEKAKLIEHKLTSVKNKVVEQIEKSESILQELNSYDFIAHCVSFGTLLQKFREDLHITNQEFASEDFSVSTVSNFFAGRYKPSYMVLKSLIGTILKIYDDSTSLKVQTRLSVFEKLANSDIFWDEVSSVEFINKSDDFVYDLTIENTHNFVANGLFAHNTSLLSACLTELMKKYRICTVEDSVTGDSKLMYRINNQFKRTTIGELIDPLVDPENKIATDNLEILTDLPEKIEVYSIDEFGKLHLSPVSAVSRHKVKKKIYEIETRTGRKIKVTEDHSLFSLNNSAQICPIPTKQLKAGNYIATPRTLKLSQKNLDFLNLADYTEKLNGYFVSKNISKYIQENRKKVLKLAKKYNYSDSTVGSWVRNGILPSPIFKELDLKENLPLTSLKYKEGGHSREINCKIGLTEELLSFMGMWLADGCYDQRSIILSIADKEAVDIITKISKLFGCALKKHSDGFSYMFNSKTVKEVMISVLGLTGNSHTKRIPNLIYNLSEKQIGAFLKGLFSGDGYTAKYEVGISLINAKLISDVQTLLLGFGIISRVRLASGKGTSSYNTSHNMISLRISGIKFLEEFRKKVNFVQNHRKEFLEKLCNKNITHDNTDIIPISLDFKKRLSVICPSFSTYDYITRENNLGREKLASLIEEIPAGDTELLLTSKDLAESDVFWDQIKSIKEIEHDGSYVYDLSVPQNESFVCENILAHNTLEIPVSSLRDLGYNVERMKSRSVITQVESELSADDAIRTALRLGDSVLIIGEVRSLEAKSLYEAMRIGALANFVAGTIHGDSAYGVFDRVVNDLGVPPTSFKATDIVVVANTLRSPDGLHTFRRVTNIVEVRKEWTEDPLKEHAFVDLMIYDSQKDELVPTDTLLNGESFVLNSIANNIREWKNDWTAIWNNILLRAKIKETLVKYSRDFKKPEILEAEFTVKSNEKFHELSEFVKQDQGIMNSKKIFSLWLNWVKKELKLQNIKANDFLL